MQSWLTQLRADPVPWLLEDGDPVVSYATLVTLLGRPVDSLEASEARRKASESPPISVILANQHPDGYWVKPGAGYGPKYMGTIWQLVFLDQMSADPDLPGIGKVCEYVMSHAQTSVGGFGASSSADKPPPPSTAIHCLNGNILRALIGFGHLADPRVQRAIDWQARSVTGEGFIYFKSGASGRFFACSANEGLPCAWGGVKAMHALARIPEQARSPLVGEAIRQGAEFLLSKDPADADYPMGWGNTKPNGSWFKLGFPSGYVTDVLQTLEALVASGYAKDQRLSRALEWLLAKQDTNGRWKNEYNYAGKMWVDIDEKGKPSKWVTLRACRVLKAVYG